MATAKVIPGSQTTLGSRLSIDLIQSHTNHTDAENTPPSTHSPLNGFADSPPLIAPPPLRSTNTDTNDNDDSKSNEQHIAQPKPKPKKKSKPMSASFDGPLYQEDAVRIFNGFSRDKRFKSGIPLAQACLVYKTAWELHEENGRILPSRIVRHFKQILPKAPKKSKTKKSNKSKGLKSTAVHAGGKEKGHTKQSSSFLRRRSGQFETSKKSLLGMQAAVQEHKMKQLQKMAGTLLPPGKEGKIGMENLKPSIDGDASPLPAVVQEMERTIEEKADESMEQDKSDYLGSTAPHHRIRAATIHDMASEDKQFLLNSIELENEKENTPTHEPIKKDVTLLPALDLAAKVDSSHLNEPTSFLNKRRGTEFRVTISSDGKKSELLNLKQSQSSKGNGSSNKEVSTKKRKKKKGKIKKKTSSVEDDDGTRILYREDATEIFSHFDNNKRYTKGIPLAKACAIFALAWELDEENGRILPSRIIRHFKQTLPSKRAENKALRMRSKTVRSKPSPVSQRRRNTVRVEPNVARAVAKQVRFTEAPPVADVSSPKDVSPSLARMTSKAITDMESLLESDPKRTNAEDIDASAQRMNDMTKRRAQSHHFSAQTISRLHSNGATPDLSFLDNDDDGYDEEPSISMSISRLDPALPEDDDDIIADRSLLDAMDKVFSSQP